MLGTKLSYFDPRRKNEIIFDGRPFGGCLIQIGKVLSYAIRVLSDVESRYSQTERAVWGVKYHFHVYVYGVRFSVIAYHIPLLDIFKNHMQTASPWIGKHRLRWKHRLRPVTEEWVLTDERYNSWCISLPFSTKTSMCNDHILHILEKLNKCNKWKSAAWLVVSALDFKSGGRGLHWVSDY